MSYDHEDFSFVLTLAFFASLAIIGSSLLLNRQGHWHAASKAFVVTNACIGLICFLVVVFSSNLELDIAAPFSLDIKYGAFLTAVGFILSIVAVLEMPQKLENDDINAVENESNP